MLSLLHPQTLVSGMVSNASSGGEEGMSKPPSSPALGPRVAAAPASREKLPCQKRRHSAADWPAAAAAAIAQRCCRFKQPGGAQCAAAGHLPSVALRLPVA